jgi:hypothetical protein
MKSLFVISLFASIMLLCSCTKGADRVIIDDGNKKADTRIEQILETLKNNDQDSMKELFSKQALDEADDFDNSIEYLFDFFQGNVDSLKRDRFTSETSTESGKKSIMLISWYTVTTDKDKYMFFVIDYSKNTINPNNVGLYTLRVIKAEDEATQFATWQKMKFAGIYEPK